MSRSAIGQGLARVAALRWVGLRLNDRRGSAMIEFAIVALPFLFIVFGIIELGLIFVADVNLSNSALGMARAIRVGAIIAPGISATSTTGVYMDLSDFKAALCNNIGIVPTTTCLNQIQVDIRTQTSYGSMSSGNPMSGQNFNSSSLCYYSGVSGNIVTMNVYYLWPVQTPILTAALNGATSYTTSSGTTNGNFFVLSASEVFKNEPNPNGTNNGSGC